MQGSNRIFVMVLVAAMALTACSGTATTTTIPPATVAPTTATTASPTTTTSAPPTTTTVAPTTTLPEGTVGDPAALQALAEEVATESLIPIEEFFIPNITQPDPIEALKELLAFSDWMLFDRPVKELVQIHTMTDSPARTMETNVVDPIGGFGLEAVAPSPFQNDRFEIVDVEDLPATPSIRASLPEGSVATRFYSTSEGYELVSVESGEVFESFSPWTELAIYVVIAPTEYGWQEYWYGTE